MPESTRHFLNLFYEAAGDPDPGATVQSFAIRHAIVRSWGEFQETHPLIVAPISTEMPFRAGTASPPRSRA